jgi:hypothetical protein
MCRKHGVDVSGDMSRLLFQTQFSFPNGQQMCTTACMQIAMGMLCGQIKPEEDSCNWHTLRQKINDCMSVGSTVHGRVESILNKRLDARAVVGGGRHHMVSVNELINTLRIDLGSLGVCTEELIICSRGRCTTTSPRKNAQPGHPKYETSSCFLCLDKLAECMIVKQEKKPTTRHVCVALATANGHTVCMSCYGEGVDSFSFCDPAPGELCIGLSASVMEDMLRKTLHIPDCAATSSTQEPQFTSSKKGRMRVKHLGDASDYQGGGDQSNEFHCDVTLFYLRGSVDS